MLGETVGSINISTTGYLIQRTNKTTNTIEYPETTIFHIHLISGSGGGTVLTIANGSGGTQQINATGTTSKGIDFDFGIWGITFPAGAYVTVDSNISNAVITCKGSKF
jgi:hypothetical protein